MKYRYNITHSVSGKKTVVNFKNERSLLKYLNSKRDKVNEMERVYINFAAVCLPLKSTVWHVDSTVTEQVTEPVPEPVKTDTKPTVKKPTMSKKKLAETRARKRLIKRMEKRLKRNDKI
jgi:hypothetical protein